MAPRLDAQAEYFVRLQACANLAFDFIEKEAAPTARPRRRGGFGMEDVAARLARLYEETPVLVAAFDRQDRLRYANGAFRAAYFVAPGESLAWSDLMRRNHAAGRGALIEDTDVEAWLVTARSRRGKTAFRAFEADLHDGRWLWMTETVEPDGWMLCIASDITSIHADERAVRMDRDLAVRAAQTDTLTGIGNLRFITARVEELAERARATGRSAGSICVLDLDHFKAVNDRYGHSAGDAVLKDFARRVLAQVRLTDSFGRVGGEEFVLVFPGTAPQAAARIMERILAQVRASRALPDWPDFSYGFSAGVAEALPEVGAKALYARADRALYVAKLTGRGRVVCDGDPQVQAMVREGRIGSGGLHNTLFR